MPTDAPSRFAWALSQLAVPARARVLEIGCGGGHALALGAERFPRARWTGIDRSATQVAAARRRLASIASAERPSVEQLSLEEAAAKWTRARFDVVFAINVNAFWIDPEAAFASLASLLKPRAHAVLVYEPPSASGVARIQAALERACNAAGARIDRAVSERAGRRGILVVRCSFRGRTP